MAGYNLYRALADQQIIAPYVQNSLMKHTWPNNVQIPNPHYHDSIVDDYFHPSTHSLYGELAIWTMLHPEARKQKIRKDDRDYSGYITPLMGTVYHVIIQQNLINDGLVKPEDVEIRLIDEKRHWRGSADLRFRGELVDIKSMNSRSFANVKGPYNSWKYQLHPYMDNMGLDTSMVLVVEMGMPWKMKEFRINLDPNLLDEIYSKWERVQRALKTGIPPKTCCKPENSAYCPIGCKGKIPPKP